MCIVLLGDFYARSTIRRSGENKWSVQKDATVVATWIK